MKLHKPWMIRLAARLGAGVLRAWMSTVRYRIDSLGQQTDPWDPNLRERFIYCLWHENLIGALTVRSVAPMSVIVSHSADGELLTRMLECYGKNTVRGSSSNGGLEAVDEILKLNMQSHLVVAPDGPRGPRHEVKRGLVYLSAWTQLPIVPLGFACRRAWRAKSWDRLAFPVPGTTLCIVGGPMIKVPAGLGKKTMEEYRQLVQRSMMTAGEVAEAWAQGKTKKAEWPNAAPAPAAAA